MGFDEHAKKLIQCGTNMTYLLAALRDKADERTRAQMERVVNEWDELAFGHNALTDSANRPTS